MKTMKNFKKILTILTILTSSSLAYDKDIKSECLDSFNNSKLFLSKAYSHLDASKTSITQVDYRNNMYYYRVNLYASYLSSNTFLRCNGDEEISYNDFDGLKHLDESKVIREYKEFIKSLKPTK